ncbi:MAG: hypothetical protein JO020_29100, partial [Chloroflexi bacterium]|nr:hypothetical protein [Chloroflexota bacterium]
MNGLVVVAAGDDHAIALKSDGTMVAWGFNNGGQTNVPPGLSGVVTIAAGGEHNLALKSAGTVVAWGTDTSGETNVPVGLSGVVAIAAGAQHSMVLKSDGTVVSWGNTYNGQDVVPAGLHNVSAIGAGDFFSLAVVNQDATPPATSIGISPPVANGSNGWYTTPVTVSVSASDANDAAATIQTRCALDPELTPMSFGDLPSTKCVYLGSGAAVSADGMHTVYAASQDAAGNTESALQTASFKLDQTAPTITAVPTTTPNANGWYNSNVNVH